MNKLIQKFQYPLLAVFLIAGFWVRLYRIEYPLADWHSWRQADTSAVTRNFVKTGVDILHPKYDDFSDVSGKGLLNSDGFRFVEFPVYNLIHYLLFSLSRPFGSLETWGRITTIIAGLTSSVLLFFIVRRNTNPLTGLMTSFFYLFLPFNIYFTRVILPDPLMVTLYLAVLNCFDVWTKNQKSSLLILSAFFGALAVLVKPAAVFFLIPVTWWFWKKYGLKIISMPQFLLLHLAFAVPFTVWRFWSYQFPQGIPASTWLFNGDHIRFKPAFWRWLFGERIGKLILGVWGLVPLSAGLTGTSHFLPWVGSALLYLSVFATGNVRHDYYQIPIIPVICILLAIGTVYLLQQKLISRVLTVFCIVMMLGMSWYDIRGNFNVNNWEMIEAGKRVDEITPQDAIVAAPLNGDTAFLYQTNRRGFSYIPFPIKDLIDRFNVTYYVSVNFDDQTNAIMKKYTVIEQNPKFVIVKLVEPKRL